MPGVSLSVLRVDDTRLALLDAPADAPAWPGHGRIGPARRIVAPEPAPPASPAAAKGPLTPALRQAPTLVASALEAAEPQLTELDARAGDGDLGLSIQRAAGELRALPEGALVDPPTALAAMAEALRRAIGGSSGPFYATALMRAARSLPPAPRAQDWAMAFREAVAAIGAALRALRRG